MKCFEGYKLHAVQNRLGLVIHDIVERHRTAGRVLTWKLVHEIEREAFRTLEEAGDLDRRYLRMMRSSRWGYIPKVDEPADLRAEPVLPETVTMIQDAFLTSH